MLRSEVEPVHIPTGKGLKTQFALVTKVVGTQLLEPDVSKRQSSRRFLVRVRHPKREFISYIPLVSPEERAALATLNV